MSALILLLFGIYFLFVGAMIIALENVLNCPPLPQLKNEPFVSVVIAARNEGAKIEDVIRDILQQAYRHFELIIVDDHSDDNTADVVSKFTSANANITLIANHDHGKKHALRLGIQCAKGTIIVTTDADCRLPITWLKTIVVFFERSDTQLVFGGVKISTSSFFSSIQAHEFLSLIGTAAASAAIGMPTMCNGANLAFRKTAFNAVGGYGGTMQIPSGDDEFLMQKILKRYPGGVRFVTDQNAVVSTTAAQNLAEFVQQRLRWAGKWRYSLSKVTPLVAVFIFLFHMAVLALPVAMLVDQVSLSLGVFLVLSKLLLEALFLKKVSSFLNVRWRWRIFFILQLLYSFYAVAIGLIATFSSFRWKERKLKSFNVSVLKNNPEQ